MDGDMGSMLQSVLSDPEQMAKIAELAQGLMGSQEKGDEAPAASPPAGGTQSGDRLMSLLTKAMSDGAGKSRSTELLRAMRPYMKPEKQEKLDRAMRIAKMARVAGLVMGEFGGVYGL